MRIGVVVFPGSNCDHDAWYAASKNLGQTAEFLWHDQREIGNADAIVVPGGFSYGATESFVATLSLYSGAYLVEVFRAGLDAVPKGALDAGKAIGLTPWQRLIHVRFPIMLRIVLPSLSNAFISLFKDTSLASVIAVPELTYGANWIKTNTFRAVEVWMIVAPMYIVTGYVILAALRLLERTLIKGVKR